MKKQLVVGDNPPEQFVKLVESLNNRFGNIDGWWDNRGYVYFRADEAVRERDYYPSLCVLTVGCRQDRLYFINFDMSIPLWDFLRKAGIDMTQVKHI